MATRRRPRRSATPTALAATLAALTVAYWAPALGLPRLDAALLNGNLLVPDVTAVSFAWLVGLGHTLVLGVLLAEAYRRWVRDRLPGGPATRGALWGLVLTLVAGLTVFPLLYGGGLFGTEWNPGLPITLALTLVVWGAIVGLGDDRAR